MTAVDTLPGGCGGGESWVPSNINKAHYDYYYFLIGGLCFVILFYFVWCCKRYNRWEINED